MLPVLTNMLKSDDISAQFADLQEPTAIILAPTRELAIQIHEEGRLLAKGRSKLISSSNKFCQIL